MTRGKREVSECFFLFSDHPILETGTSSNFPAETSMASSPPSLKARENIHQHPGTFNKLQELHRTINQQYLSFCEDRRIKPDPVTEGKLAIFQTFLSEKLKPESVLLYIYWARKLLTKQQPPDNSLCLQQIVQAHQRVSKQ